MFNFFVADYLLKDFGVIIHSKGKLACALVLDTVMFGDNTVNFLQNYL